MMIFIKFIPTLFRLLNNKFFIKHESMNGCMFMLFTIDITKINYNYDRFLNNFLNPLCLTERISLIWQWIWWKIDEIIGKNIFFCCLLNLSCFLSFSVKESLDISFRLIVKDLISQTKQFMLWICLVFAIKFFWVSL